jgi:membrane protein
MTAGDPDFVLRLTPEDVSIWRHLRILPRVEVLKGVWANIGASRHNLIGRSAELAFYFFLALFPGMLFVLTLVGLLAGDDSGLRSSRFDYAALALPPSVRSLLEKTISETAKSAVGWRLFLSALAALWSASAGTSSLIGTLNSIFQIEEQRPWWKTQLLAISLTLALSLLMVTALMTVLFGGYLADLANSAGLGTSAILGWKIAQWPLAVVVVILALAILYHWAPARAKKKWHWISPGGVMAIALWVAVSVLFRAYLTLVNSFASTYGSLSAVIILMLWFYMTSASILLGAEIDAQILCAVPTQRAKPNVGKGWRGA